MLVSPLTYKRAEREFGTPENVFCASLTALEACNLPAPAAQAIWRAGKEVDAIRRIGCRVLNCTEPEYPQGTTANLRSRNSRPVRRAATPGVKVNASQEREASGPLSKGYGYGNRVFKYNYVNMA